MNDERENTAPDPDAHTALLATVPSPYEAGIIEARLAGAGITYQTNHITSQFAFTSGALAGSEIYVTEADLELARGTLEVDDTGESDSDEEAVDRERAQVKRRYKIARFFLWPLGVVYIGLFALSANLIDGLVNFGVGLALLILAHRSHKEPRSSFLWCFLILAATSLWGMWVGLPFLVVPGFFSLVAVYFAWEAAGKSGG